MGLRTGLARSRLDTLRPPSYDSVWFGPVVALTSWPCGRITDAWAQATTDRSVRS